MRHIYGVLLQADSAPECCFRHNVPMTHTGGAATGDWTTSVTPIPPPRSANPTLRFLLYAGLLTGIWAGLLSLLVYWISRAAGVTFELDLPQGQGLLPWYQVLVMPLVIALVFALLAALVRGRAHAGRIVFWVGTVGALVSCAGPIGQPVGWMTRILLIAMHAITWVLVVPQIARIVGDSEPSKSVDRPTL